MSRRIFCISSLFFLPAWAPAQQAQIAGPVSGYVFDGAAHGMRPILGIPGASLFGDPISFGFPVASASVAPRQDAAFVTAADGTFHLFRIQSGASTELTLNGVAATPERIVFSPSGTAAALYRAGSIQIVGGLPDSAAIAASLDVSGSGTPNALALSDDGGALLLASGSSIELFAGAADLGKVADTAGPALVAFAPGRRDAAVVDGAGAGIVLYRNLTAATEPQTIAPADDTTGSSSALAFSPDGQTLIVANASSQSVTLFDLAAGARNAISCSCAPSALVRMGDLFRLGDLVQQQPLWVLDARPETAGIKFVPAAADAAAKPAPRRTEPSRRGLKPVFESTSPAAPRTVRAE